MFDEDLDQLLWVAAEARQRGGLDDFADFAELRGRGVRRAALKHLNTFLDRTAAWSHDDRLAFTVWLLRLSDRFGYRGLINAPLHERLVSPTLHEWTVRAPDNAEAWLWRGLMHSREQDTCLRRALDLDPSCEQARQGLVNAMLSSAEFNQHHMPDFYINDPRIDLRQLDDAMTLARGSSDSTWLGQTADQIGSRRVVAEAWLAAHPRAGDFAT